MSLTYKRPKLSETQVVFLSLDANLTSRRMYQGNSARKKLVAVETAVRFELITLKDEYVVIVRITYHTAHTQA